MLVHATSQLGQLCETAEEIVAQLEARAGGLKIVVIGNL
jgi:hypothetical protein